MYIYMYIYIYIYIQIDRQIDIDKDIDIDIDIPAKIKTQNNKLEYLEVENQLVTKSTYRVKIIEVCSCRTVQIKSKKTPTKVLLSNTTG